MRAVRPLLTVLATLASTFAAVSANAGALANVEVYDRTAGQTLPIYEHEGRLYVAGEPRHQYEVRVRNSSANRVLAVASVDGVNVITGETAAQEQSGYVLDAWDSVSIEGWRKSMDDVATFYFTRLKDSYAARTGRPNDVGVIGVALFREYRPYRPCCAGWRERASPGVVAPPEASGEMQDDSAELSRDAAGTAQKRAEKAEAESKLGTGHGHRESSPAQYVDFRRASAAPDETIVIYYDSRRNLVAQGVLPQRSWYADRRPDPFPNGFVPDPR